jgi:hypothetical protein
MDRFSCRAYNQFKSEIATNYPANCTMRSSRAKTHFPFITPRLSLTATMRHTGAQIRLGRFVLGLLWDVERRFLSVPRGLEIRRDIHVIDHQI